MDAPLQSNLLTKRIQSAYLRTYRKDRNSILGLLVACTLLSFFGVYLFDRLTEFPAVIRVLLTLGIIGGIWFWMYRKQSSGLKKSSSLEEMARDVERRAQGQRPGGFHSLLVSATEFGALGRQHGSEAFRKRAVQQAEESGNDPTTLTLHSQAAAHRTTKLLGIAIAIYVIWGLLSPASMAIFFARAAGLSVSYPTRTRIENIDVPERVGRFEDVPFLVEAGGVLPVQGTIQIGYEKGNEFDLVLTPVPETPNTYQAVLERPPKSFDYQIHLGDAKSFKKKVTVLPPPVLRDGQLTLNPPSYLDRSPIPRPLGSFQLFEGGSFDLFVTTDGNAETCSLELGDRSLPMQPSGEGFSIRGVTLDATTPFSIRLVGQGGVENTRRPQYRATVMTDEPPQVILVNPRGGEFVAPPSLIRWNLTADDDLGLGETVLRATVIQPEVLGSEGEVLQPASTINTSEQSLSNLEGVKEAEQEGEFTAEQFGATPGTRLQLQFRVTDRYPNRAAEDGWTDPVNLDVVSAQELKKILAEELVGAHLMIQDIQDDMEAQRTAVRMRLNPKTQPRGQK